MWAWIVIGSTLFRLPPEYYQYTKPGLTIWKNLTWNAWNMTKIKGCSKNLSFDFFAPIPAFMHPILKILVLTPTITPIIMLGRHKNFEDPKLSCADGQLGEHWDTHHQPRKVPKNYMAKPPIEIAFSVISLSGWVVGSTNLKL